MITCRRSGPSRRCNACCRNSVLMAGAVVSLPGAEAQNFHADGSPLHFALASKLSRHRLFQVFFPLQDIAEDADGTQLWPCSHLAKREREFWEARGESGRVEDDPEAMEAMRAPACSVGDVLVFDYRMLHRGLPNGGPRERPVGYIVLSTGFAFDRQNFEEAPRLWAKRSA